MAADLARRWGSRERVGRSLPVWYLVPDGVVQYIQKRDLYQAAP